MALGVMCSRLGPTRSSEGSSPSSMEGRSSACHRAEWFDGGSQERTGSASTRSRSSNNMSNFEKIKEFAKQTHPGSDYRFFVAAIEWIRNLENRFNKNEVTLAETNELLRKAEALLPFLKEMAGRDKNNESATNS